MYRSNVLVCGGTGCTSSNSELIIQRLKEEIKAQGARVLALDALSLAEQAGSVKAVNVVLIGAMAKTLGTEPDIWLKSIEATVPPKFVEMNKRAFELGYAAVS